MSAPLNLLDVFARIPDPRGARGQRHPLPAILSLAVLAMLCGAKSYAAISQFGRDKGFALAHALGFRRGKTPAPSTFCVTFRAIDVGAFEAALSRWAQSRLPAAEGEGDGEGDGDGDGEGDGEGDGDGEAPAELLALAIDGKTARGSRDGQIPGAHLLAAYAPAAGAVLAQLRVEASTNEHKAALELLGVLPLEGRVVTGDAMFCQKDICSKVVGEGGDYLFAVKDNQKSLATDIAAGLAFGDQARRLQAAFPPLHRSPAAAGDGGPGGRQGARPGGGAHLPHDHDVDAAAAMAGAQPGLRVDPGADGEGEDDPGGELRDDQLDAGEGGRGEDSGAGPGALGDREPAALGAGRDAGGGRQPGEVGFGPGGDGGAAQLRGEPGQGGGPVRGRGDPQAGQLLLKSPVSCRPSAD